MNFDIHLAIYDCKIEKIPDAIIAMMTKEGFVLIDDELKLYALQNTDDILPEVDEQLMLVRFLIRPQKNKWAIVYPTGSYNDFQFFGLELSKDLGCITTVILRDDSSGWGYEIYQNGQVLDKYHTNPYTSSTLHEREELAIKPRDHYHFDLDPALLKAEYQGNPTLVAQLFDIDEHKIREYLTIGKYASGSDTHQKLAHFWLALDIADNDKMYYEALDDADENWSHLIFVRQMTPVELKWHAQWKDAMPFTRPPLWLKRESED